MREMVLNHASVAAPDEGTAVGWLTGLISGMRSMIDDGVVEASLRTSRHPQEIPCVSDWTLYDLFIEILQRGYKEEFLFAAGLSTKTPLLTDIDGMIANRFLGCEHTTLSRLDGEPLVYCAITDNVSVGFPSATSWRIDQISITFDELLSDGNVIAVVEQIDNLTMQTHAAPIIERHRSRFLDGLFQFPDGPRIWNSRSDAFPHLTFGPDVEGHLVGLNPGHLSTVVNKLLAIDDSAARWPQHQGNIPPWGSKVTDESSKVKNNRELREARRFMSCDGTSKLFLWHARFGRYGRIHVHFDRGTYGIEIGYIGNHLPLS